MDKETTASFTLQYKIKSLAIVVALCLASLAVSVLLSNIFSPWERATADLYMKWRYTLTQSPNELASPEILFISLDQDTQRRMGRYGGTTWASREPYIDQVRFFKAHLRPTVLAYDIVFQDSLELGAVRRRVSENSNDLATIANEIRTVAEQPGEAVSEGVLRGLSRLTVEQGDGTLAAVFAEIAGRKQDRFPTVVGAYFLGGHVDPLSNVPHWSDSDVFGANESGDEAEGKRIPFLRDIAIPDVDVHLLPGQSYSYSLNAVTPYEDLMNYATLGFVNGPRDPDGTIRRVPLVMGFSYRNRITGAEKRVFVPGFSLLCCLMHMGVEFPLKPGVLEVFFGRHVVINLSQGRSVTIPVDESGNMYLNCTIDTRDFRHRSFYEVAPLSGVAAADHRSKMARRLAPEVNGRIAIVGVSLAGTDVGNCPLSPNTPMVYVHLMGMNNILRREFLQPMLPSQKRILYALLFVSLVVIGAFSKPSRLGATAFLVIMLYLVVSYSAVHRSITVMPVVGPVFFMVLGSFSVLSYRFLTEERAKRRIRGMFSTMVSDKVLSYLEERPDSFSLSGRNADVTILSTDIANFTKMSEALTPDRLTSLMNMYFTPVSNEILAHGGYIDKYMGDGVMAVWGAPYQDPDHVVKACRSALAQQRAIRLLNAEFERQFGFRIRTRMGIHTGMATAGNMGSDRKFQYTVIGDAVNLAFRLEPVNKDFGTEIIISHAVLARTQGRFVTRHLGRIVVVGKTEVVDIHELVGESGTVDEKTLGTIREYEFALKAFHDRKWNLCRDLLDKLLLANDDLPSRFLRELAGEFSRNEPDAGWSGEYQRRTKG